MTLRLAVNVRTLDPDRIGGLEAAFRQVFDLLLRRDPGELAVTLLTSSGNHDAFDAWGHRVARRLVPLGAERVDWPELLAGFDVLYCPLLFLEPEAPPIPAVVAIPDLQHLTHPEFFDPELLTLRLRRLRAGATRANRVLTISEFSRAEIVRAFHLPRRRVAVTPLDAAPRFRRPPSAERLRRLRARLELPERWLLYPANDWPHKNHRAIFRALRLYRERFAGPPPLLLTGARVSGADLEAEARQEGVGRLVRHLGWVDPDDLPELYDGADALVYASLFEGFGMPVVEAMRRGTPVLASSATSLPEITGGHALLVDPAEPAAIAAGLHELLSRPAETRARADAARSWAERFSFERAAEQTLELFHEAVGERVPPLSLATVEEPPRVFVVTPSYQQAPYLRAAIESVLAQEYPRLDYLVADGGSTDGSVEILRSFGEKLAWKSGPDGGQAAAIAAAWRESRADVVAWLNSDDVYLPGAVARAVDHLLAHPEAAMVYGQAWYLDAQGNRTGSYPTLPFDAALLRQDCFICQPAAFVRREVFHRIAFPDPALRYCMDYDLWIRLSREFGVSHLEQPLAGARVHADTKSLRERGEVYEEILRVTRGHFGIAPRNWLIGALLFRTDSRVERALARLPTVVRKRLAARLVSAAERRAVSTLHSDGWTGTRSVIEVRPGDGGRVRLRAQSPFWPYRRPLRIAVEKGHRTLARHRCDRRGEFWLEFTVPTKAGRDGDRTEVVLRANRTFVPWVVGWAPDDPRPISFRVLDGAAGLVPPPR